MTKYLISFRDLEVPSREAAVQWAAKIAKACRCAQELRAFQYDPRVKTSANHASGRISGDGVVGTPWSSAF